MFSVAFDRVANLIVCTASGFQAMDEVRDHIFQLKAMIDRVRPRLGYVRVLVLAQELEVHSPEVVEEGSRLRRRMLALHHPRDRMAYVYSHSLPRMQADRTIEPDRARTFLSEATARAWLMEGHGRGPAAAPPPPASS